MLDRNEHICAASLASSRVASRLITRRAMTRCQKKTEENPNSEENTSFISSNQGRKPRPTQENSDSHRPTKTSFRLAATERRGYWKAVVAIAAKNATLAWAVLKYGEDFRLNASAV